MPNERHDVNETSAQREVREAEAEASVLQLAKKTKKKGHRTSLVLIFLLATLPSLAAVLVLEGNTKTTLTNAQEEATLRGQQSQANSWREHW